MEEGRSRIEDGRWRMETDERPHPGPLPGGEGENEAWRARREPNDAGFSLERPANARHS
jgi:hypothetical protein